MDAVVTLVAAVRAALRASVEPQQAPAMQAYMKSTLPFLGVSSPARKAALAGPLAAAATLSRDEWEIAVRLLWDEATHREERYAALALAEHPKVRRHRDLASIALYDHLITTGAWWDLVDETATRLVGPLRREHPRQIDPIVRSWATQDDLWLRRAAIICQVGSRQQSDPELLADILGANLEDRRFFIAKAVGWALRDYARTDPDWVRDYVARHRFVMAPLSVREALRHL